MIRADQGIVSWGTHVDRRQRLVRFALLKKEHDLTNAKFSAIKRNSLWGKQQGKPGSKRALALSFVITSVVIDSNTTKQKGLRVNVSP